MQKTFHSKNPEYDLDPGQRWVGKWNGNPYQVIKKLGEGATGTVYLVNTRNGQAAVKIGMNKFSLTSEINVLKQFSKVRGNVLGPSLLDVDDIEMHGNVLPFFCMEYLKGDNLLTYIEKKGTEWAPILMVQLLGDLDRLHKSSWIFGDLKPENIIVTGPPARVRWFDVGGTTKTGRAIKEYTEFYDRGYWGFGDRRAEPTYDLFAASMILLECIYKKRFEKPASSMNGKEFLLRKVTNAPVNKPYKTIIMKALNGKYTDAQLMKKDLMTAIDTFSLKDKQHSNDGIQDKKKTKPMRHTKKRHTEKRSSYKVEIVLTVSFLFLSSILYLMGQWI